MAKLIIGILSIIVCFYIGKNTTSKYSKRQVYYIEFERLLNCLMRNLKFKRENIISVLSNFASTCPDFDCTIKSATALISHKEVSNQLYIPNWIDDQDAMFFYNFFEKIGAQSTQSELDFLSEIQYILNEKLLKIKENNVKFTKLGQRLGISLGLTIFILIL